MTQIQKLTASTQAHAADALAILNRMAIGNEQEPEGDDDEDTTPFYRNRDIGTDDTQPLSRKDLEALLTLSR